MVKFQGNSLNFVSLRKSNENESNVIRKEKKKGMGSDN